MIHVFQHYPSHILNEARKCNPVIFLHFNVSFAIMMFLLKYFLLYRVIHLESVCQDANAVSGINTMLCVDNV